MTENNLIFIKLGGSLLTEKSTPYTINYRKIKGIIKEIKESIDENPNLKLLIGNGGGSFSHSIADSFKTIDGFVQENSKRGFILCQNASSTLNRILVDLMIDYGINAVSIQTSACCITDNGKIANFFIQAINTSIHYGIIPVIFGDCVFDTVKGCTIVSTEQILIYLSKLMRPSRVLIFTLVGGVYTSDPQKNKKAKLVPEISLQNFNEIESYLGDSYSVDVTGGMSKKVKDLLNVAEMGIECEILSGENGNIKNALMGRRGLGTIIKPVLKDNNQTYRLSFKPLGLSILDNVSYTDCLTQFVKILASDENFEIKIQDHRISKYFSHDFYSGGSGGGRSRLIKDNIYLKVNFSAKDTIKVAYEILEVFGYSRADLTFK